MSQPAPPTLAYRPPENRGALFFTHYAFYFTALLIPTGVACYLFLGVIPKYVEIFKDFRTTLPAYTRIVLEFSAIFRYWIVWLPVLAMIMVIPLPLALHTSALTPDLRRKRLRRMTLGIALLGLLILLLVGSAVLLPLIKLIQSVNGGENGGN